MRSFDCIVIGTGGVGSAALYHAARRGGRVLGIDRFPGGHDRGSSHGRTRIIRQAYFEHPDYVPLVLRAYELWADLAAAIGRQLFFQVGLIEVGPRDGVVVPGVLESAARHSLRVETLSVADVAERFPGFVVPDGDAALFEPLAGFLLVEDCVRAHLAEASRHGAELAIGDEVVHWSRDERTGNGTGGFVVETARDRFHADRLIIAAGPWATALLSELEVPLRVVRKHLHWYEADSIYRADRGCPCFFYERPGGYFYGFPQTDNDGVKVAEHSGGVEIDDPLRDERKRDESDQQRVERFLTECLPGVRLRSPAHDVCYYTMSPDEHFIVDHLPGAPRGAFVSGLSGHGFKFASVLGEALTDLVFDGSTSQPIDFIGLSRFRSQRP